MINYADEMGEEPPTRLFNLKEALLEVAQGRSVELTLMHAYEEGRVDGERHQRWVIHRKALQNLLTS
jgi:hypothetical protein